MGPVKVLTGDRLLFLAAAFAAFAVFAVVADKVYSSLMWGIFSVIGLIGEAFCVLVLYRRR